MREFFEIERRGFRTGRPRTLLRRVKKSRLQVRKLRAARAANYSMVIRYIPIDASLSCRLSEMKAEYMTHAIAKLNAPLLEIPVASGESEKFLVFRGQIGIGKREE